MLGRRESSPSQTNVEALKKDASQVLNNLTDLSRKLAEVGRERTGNLARGVSEHFEEDIERLRERIDLMSRDLQKLGQSLDSHVRTNPYLYVFGALGAGAILGKLFRRRSA